jgi:hypothetical protein
MRLFDIRQRRYSSGIVQARRALRRGEQVLVVNDRQGSLVGMLMDQNLPRLVETLGRLGPGVEHFKVLPDGSFGANLFESAVYRAMDEAGGGA